MTRKNGGTMYEFDVLRMSVLDEESPAAVETLRTIVLDAPITDVPRGPALTLAPEAAVATAIDAMRRRARPAIVVVQQQRPLGIVTERDVAACAADEIDDTPLSAVMTSCPRPLRASETVGAAFRTMCA